MGVLKNVINAVGMTDQIAATDLLISTKSGVINTALALTESATPELRKELERQLFEAIDTHREISQYMMKKGYYDPYNLKNQLNIDLNTTDKTKAFSPPEH